MLYIVQFCFLVFVHTSATEYAISPPFSGRFLCNFFELVALVEGHSIALLYLLSGLLGDGHVLISPQNRALCGPAYIPPENVRIDSLESGCKCASNAFKIMILREDAMELWLERCQRPIVQLHSLVCLRQS